MDIALPSWLRIDESKAGNCIKQVGSRSVSVSGALIPFTRGKLRGYLFRPDGSPDDEILIVPNGRTIPDGYLQVIQASVQSTDHAVDLTGGIWVKGPIRPKEQSPMGRAQEIENVLKSWRGAFSYVAEDLSQGIKGLRGPQIGAVHAVHAHWAVSDSPATIVMPTGTGKTETMLAILVSTPCPKLLVVVPTDALRTQIASKFLTLGILKDPDCAVLAPSAKTPIVGTLAHIPRNVAEVDEVFENSQVIITTSSIAGQCKTSVQDRMAYHCPYLFIDEAHHAEAPTWTAFKERFKNRRVLQFTATPFREDGKPLDGHIIFKYPLRKAQQEGYFQTIRFLPVVEFNQQRSDEAIAAKAVEQLRKDFEKGHIVMARVDRVTRANEVFRIYSRYPEFKPVQLHTGIKSTRQRAAIRQQIIAGESRIVVCVDMLGEGFDLPELKIAAFHDIRKTLPVTLQLAGRFTRSHPRLGHATFIANTADVQVRDELRKLYSRDPDWNVLLPELSDRMIGEQQSLQEFLRGFTQFAKEIPLKTVRPAISTVVYRTKCDSWSPEKFKTGIPGIDACEQVHSTVNHQEYTLVIVTARRASLDWTDAEQVFGWEWDLYVVVWSPEQNLLFINSSGNAGAYRTLARAIAGDDVTLVQGQEVFRSFAGVNRLRLQNVGLTEQLGRNVRYTGRMGTDVAPALPTVHRNKARKSVLSGVGYEHGERITIGASRKGRIWSHQRGRVDQLADWCKQIGEKITDGGIDPDEVLKGTLEAKLIAARPQRMPIRVDWPEEIYKSPEVMWSIAIDGNERGISNLDMELVNPGLNNAVRIEIGSETERAELELELFEDEDTQDYRFVVLGDKKVQVKSGGSWALDIAKFFYENPPIIWFADGSSLEGNQYVELKGSYQPYDVARIQAWNWTGIDIRKESQGKHKDPTSIQAKVITELKRKAYNVVFDDDNKGEIADVVAVRLEGDVNEPSSIEVELYHCKYSHEATPGQRIKDLYEVCGQAQKSIAWVFSPEKRTDIFTHLLRREAQRQTSGGASRFEVGDKDQVLTIRDMSRLVPVNLRIYIVQPGVSKSRASHEQMMLLSVTENYLFETYQLPFGVIGSE